MIPNVVLSNILIKYSHSNIDDMHDGGGGDCGRVRHFSYSWTNEPGIVYSAASRLLGKTNVLINALNVTFWIVLLVVGYQEINDPIHLLDISS